LSESSETDATQIAWSFGDDNVAMSLPNWQFRRQDDRRDKNPAGIYGEVDGLLARSCA
jgi:hypothetical protein